jgi:hypothetical protein
MINALHFKISANVKNIYCGEFVNNSVFEFSYID